MPRHWPYILVILAAASIIAGAMSSLALMAPCARRQEKPIGGAAITLQLPGGRPVETLSADDGRYSITTSTWGHPTKRLTVAKNGFAPYSTELPAHPDRVVVDVALAVVQ